MTFKDWSHYFENNRNHFFDINWFTADKLEKEEKNKIAKSIQQFQIGENLWD